MTPASQIPGSHTSTLLASTEHRAETHDATIDGPIRPACPTEYRRMITQPQRTGSVNPGCHSLSFVDDYDLFGLGGDPADVPAPAPGQRRDEAATFPALRVPLSGVSSELWFKPSGAFTDSYETFGALSTDVHGADWAHCATIDPALIQPSLSRGVPATCGPISGSGGPLPSGVESSTEDTLEAGVSTDVTCPDSTSKNYACTDPCTKRYFNIVGLKQHLSRRHPCLNRIGSLEMLAAGTHPVFKVLGDNPYVHERLKEWGKTRLDEEKATDT